MELLNFHPEDMQRIYFSSSKLHTTIATVSGRRNKFATCRNIICVIYDTQQQHFEVNPKSTTFKLNAEWVKLLLPHKSIQITMKA